MSSNINDFKETKRELKQKLNNLEELISQIEEKLEGNHYNYKFISINLFLIRGK